MIRVRRESKQRRLWREGYADGRNGKEMRIAWGSGGADGHAYGMGHFHGAAHRRVLGSLEMDDAREETA